MTGEGLMDWCLGSWRTCLLHSLIVQWKGCLLDGSGSCSNWVRDTMSRWQLLPLYPHKIAKECCNRFDSWEGKMGREYMYVSEEVKGMSDPLMLGLQACVQAYDLPVWMLGIELGFSARKKKIHAVTTGPSLQPNKCTFLFVCDWVSCSLRPVRASNFLCCVTVNFGASSCPAFTSPVPELEIGTTTPFTSLFFELVSFCSLSWPWTGGLLPLLKCPAHHFLQFVFPSDNWTTQAWTQVLAYARQVQ